MWLREELQWKKHICYTWQVCEAALGSRPLPLIACQRVWVCRSMGALFSVADLIPSLLPVISQSLPPAWHFNQTFWVFTQTLTKTLWKTGCLCFHAKETSAVLPGALPQGRNQRPFPSSPRKPTSPKESPPVRACCLQALLDFTDCSTCVKTKGVRARPDTQMLDTWQLPHLCFLASCLIGPSGKFIADLC